MCSFVVCLAGLAQTVQVQPATPIPFPAPTDSNSPALRIGGQLVVYNSTGSGPIRSSGPVQASLNQSEPVVLGPSTHHPYWIEATWQDADGTILAWYHHEPGNICPGSRLTTPQIGALLSYDGGQTFTDLGIILENGYPPDCFAQNGYFAGGNGDFTVVLGRNGEYFYFLFSNYGGPVEQQGVAAARLPFRLRYAPFGAVEKYYQGAWLEPGLGGQVTPILPVNVAWDLANTDAFWGPSVHYNIYLDKFVMLLNRSCCEPEWPQEGVYVSFNSALANPEGWSAPVKILDGSEAWWYPQVIGYPPNGTDKLAGRTARLYSNGVSNWEITFEKN